MLAHDGVHLGRRKVLEPRPTIVVVGPLLFIFALGKDAALDRLLGAGRLEFLGRVQVVEPLDEQQVRDLLDHFERVTDTARPEGVPNTVDLTTDFAGEHRQMELNFRCNGWRLVEDSAVCRFPPAKPCTGGNAGLSSAANDL